MSLEKDYFNTIKWSLNVGVNPGYSLSDQKSIKEDDFARSCITAADTVERETGVYISCVISPSRAVYKKEWGCPEIGEFSYTVYGTYNPAFSGKEEYISALEQFATELKKIYGQNAVWIEISPAHLIYLKD